MQRLYKKKWKLLKLQITQTRHPKSVVDGRKDGWSGSSLDLLWKIDAGKIYDRIQLNNQQVHNEMTWLVCYIYLLNIYIVKRP